MRKTLKMKKAMRFAFMTRLGITHVKKVRTATTIMRLYFQRQNLDLIKLKHWRETTHSFMAITSLDFLQKIVQRKARRKIRQFLELSNF